MKSRISPASLALASALCLASPAHTQPAAPDESDEASIIQRVTESVTGDLPQMRQRGLVRVLVSPSRTNFFIDAGQPRGFEYEMLEEYEKHLNKGVKRGGRQTRLIYVPVPFSEIVPALRDGRGDIAAAGLTITPERSQLVAFTAPYLSDVCEIVVTAGSVDDVQTLDDLAGRTVYLAENSSYAKHLTALNDRFAAEGRAPVTIASPGPTLNTEDILEMTSAGILDLTVADRHLAEIWSTVLPDLKLHPHITINEGGRIGWAARHDSPELLASLNTFVAEHKKGTLLGNIFFKRYFKNAKWVANPLAAVEHEKLVPLIPLFQRYAEQYGFDWLLIAAQAFQESRLDQSVRSKAGAVGIMQVRPATAADLGISDVNDLEQNIHAGVKYMDYLRRTYFASEDIAPAIRRDFSLAAYNAGPKRVKQWRDKAAAHGRDPNRWFGHVERIARESSGPETVRYVGNVNKYYIAYKLGYETAQERTRERSGTD